MISFIWIDIKPITKVKKSYDQTKEKKESFSFLTQNEEFLLFPSFSSYFSSIMRPLFSQIDQIVYLNPIYCIIEE